MGGGASKPAAKEQASSEQNATSSKDGGAQKTNTTGNNGTIGAQGKQASETGFSGLSCTVMDAVTNTRVTFQSSVSATGAAPGKKKRKNKDKESTIQDALDHDDEPIDDSVIRIGDAVIATGADAHHTNSSSVARLTAQQVADRGDWRGAVNVLFQNPTRGIVSGHHAPVQVGGAVVCGTPVIDGQTPALGMTPQGANVSPSATPSTDAIAAKYTPQTKAAVFTSKTRYAVPINYRITPAGGQNAAVRTIAASADGTMFASVAAGGKAAQYFDGLTGTMIMEIKAHLDPIVAVAHSRDGKFLLTSSNDGNVCLWDLNNGKKLREIPVTSQANAVAISDDSDTIATSSTEDFVNLWESRNAEALTMFQRHSGAVYCVAFSRRGNLIASGSQNGEVFVWGAQAGDVRLHIETGARSAVLHVAFSHDGTRLITADRDVLQAWDLFTGGLVFSRNGSGEVSLGEEGKAMHQPSFVPAPKELPRITCAAFAACNTIVCGLTTRRLVVLEPNAGTELLSLDVRALVTCVSTNWAGDVIYAGDYNGNHYRLQLTFTHRDVLEYSLNSKPPSKDKGKADRD